MQAVHARHPSRLTAAAALALLALPALAAGTPAVPSADTEAASILSRRCLSCHDAAKKSGGVDLSTRAGAAAAGAAGADDPAKNRLVRAVVQGKMPPTGKLPVAEVAALRAWVRAGAPYPGTLTAVRLPDQPLWSLQPVRAPAIPRTKFDVLARNPIDRFVFRKLEERGLRPSPGASRRALLRRVSVDLTGLPPTPEEVAAFLADRSPDAYEKVVDRLLASPAYGERWAQHWLDVVRYGESHGYEQNHLRPNAWHYRDYVIRALNEDRPYTQFLTEQLAGDVVGKGNPDVEVATGFLVAGVHDTVGNQTEEGTRQQRANDLDDMVSATAETFLGLTVGCAKCHDHKFDPIPQRDYYRLAAVFAGVRHGERPLAPAMGDAEKDRRARELEAQVRTAGIELAELDAEARAAVLRPQGVTPIPRPAVGARRNLDDFPPVTARYVRFTVTATKDGAQPCLDELEVYGPDRARNLALASEGSKATASSLLPGHAIHQVHHLNDGRYGNDRSWISNEAGGGWAQVELPAPAAVSRVVWSRDFGNPLRFSDRLPSGYRIEVSLDRREWTTVVTGADRAPAPEAIPAPTLQAALTPSQKERRGDLNARLEKLRGELSALTGGKKAYVGQFTTPDPLFVLRRGDVMQRADEVQPGGLSRIPGLSAELSSGTERLSEPQRRLALARWLTDPKNPLTARVIVNRIWQGHFGRGIVPTPSDFGHNGEKPSHAELLDWLASALVSGRMGEWGNGRATAPGVTRSPAHPLTHSPPTGGSWSLKALHRLIVTSYTYRQSSAANAEGMAKDAGNRLLWRMPLRRMEAEAVRDAILHASGRLDRTMGGPGFRLYQYRVVNVAIYEPLEAYGPETWRRGVYRQNARGIRDDLLGTFDCPESSQRSPRRESTTTALQALSLLNGPFVEQQAKFFAERAAREAGPELTRQVERAFRLAFGRAPSAEERQPAVALARKHGLPSLCRALLNANEFLYY